MISRSFVSLFVCYPPLPRTYATTRAHAHNLRPLPLTLRARACVCVCARACAREHWADGRVVQGVAMSGFTALRLNEEVLAFPPPCLPASFLHQAGQPVELPTAVACPPPPLIATSLPHPSYRTAPSLSFPCTCNTCCTSPRPLPKTFPPPSLTHLSPALSQTPRAYKQ